MIKKRCQWAEGTFQEYLDYHDREWGVPVHDDRILFEFLTLEGAQAGLSWSTIIKKRQGYHEAFMGFDVKRVAEMDNQSISSLKENPEIIRNRLKIESTITNARAFIEVQKEFGSFNNYIWGFVNQTPIVNEWKKMSEVPVSTDLSDKISKDLKKRGFRFVGTTIMYAYMQAIGMVNDHTTDCFRYQELLERKNY